MVHSLKIFTRKFNHNSRYNIVGVLSILFACSPAVEERKTIDNSPLSQLSWILGDWSNESRQGMIGEHWVIINDSLFQGNGYSLNKKKDTTFKEDLKILFHEGELFYVPTVHGQNDNQPVWFRITELSDRHFICENRNHDFPQVIHYTLESEEGLYVVISGPIDGKEQKREFRFRKSKVRLMP